MRSPIRAARLAAASLALVASPLAAQRAAAPKPRLDPAADYRLSMANVEKVVPVAKALNAMQHDADVKSYMRDQRPVFERRMQALQAQGTANDGASVLLLYELLDGMPRIHKAFATAGIAPRDYALTSLHLGLNWMAVVAEKNMGRAADAPAGALGDNWRLVHTNQARIGQIMAELEKYPVDFGDES